MFIMQIISLIIFIAVIILSMEDISVLVVLTMLVIETTILDTGYAGITMAISLI